MKLSNNLFTALILGLTFACTPKAENPTPATSTEPGALNLMFDFVAGSEALTFDAPLVNDSNSAATKTYTIPSGRKVTINSIRVMTGNYYLVKENGEKLVLPESYHLVEQTAPSAYTKDVRITNVPAGTYKSVGFSVGPDSARNFSTDKQLGDLKVGIGMNWNWNTGYIFYKMEGRVENPRGKFNAYRYHIGNPPRSIPFRWRADSSNFKTIELALPQNLVINKNENQTVVVTADVLAPFGKTGSTNPLAGIQDPLATPIVMTGPLRNTVQVAANYGDNGFRVREIKK